MNERTNGVTWSLLELIIAAKNGIFQKICCALYLIEFPNHDRNFDNKSRLKIQILDTNFNHYKLKIWKLRFNFKLNFTIDQPVAQS